VDLEKFLRAFQKRKVADGDVVKRSSHRERMPRFPCTGITRIEYLDCYLHDNVRRLRGYQNAPEIFEDFLITSQTPNHAWMSWHKNGVLPLDTNRAFMASEATKINHRRA